MCQRLRLFHLHPTAKSFLLQSRMSTTDVILTKKAGITETKTTSNEKIVTLKKQNKAIKFLSSACFYELFHINIVYTMCSRLTMLKARAALTDVHTCKQYQIMIPASCPYLSSSCLVSHSEMNRCSASVLMLSRYPASCWGRNTYRWQKK